MLNPTPLTAHEDRLLDEAQALLRERRRPGLNTVVAVVSTETGRTHFGLNLVSRKSAVCAEPAAIAAAHLAGDHQVRTVAAVCFTPDLSEVTVISPCGACRELLWYHAPAARVVLRRDGQHCAVTASDLFSDAELFPA